MWIDQQIKRVWVWGRRLISGKDRRPKIPRKKLQLQFDHTKNKFLEQTKRLEKALNGSELLPSTLQLGKYLLFEIQRFQELHLDRITKNRLETTSQQLLHHADFSLWVLNQMYSYTEEIFHFIKTMEVVEL